MVSTIKAAQDAARKAQESLYFGKATVYEYKKIIDENHLAKFQEVTVLDEQPCRLSFESKKQSAQSESTNNITQVIKLFLSPDVKINPGSKITITQDNVTNDYTNSGIAAVYPTHQEIILELFEGWS